MNRFHTAMLAAVTATALVAVANTGPAGAAGDPVVGMQVLDMMCAEDGGMPINTPYAISRCQGARSSKGFAIERLTCEGLLDGTFVATQTGKRPPRATWACIPRAAPSE